MAQSRSAKEIEQALAEIETFRKLIFNIKEEEKKAQETGSDLNKAYNGAQKLIPINTQFNAFGFEIASIYKRKVEHAHLLARILRDIMRIQEELQRELEKARAAERYRVETGFPNAQITGATGRKYR